MQTRNEYLNDAFQPSPLDFAGVPGAAHTAPQKSKRARTWHASYAVLAVMTSLLLVSGCDKKDTAEQAATPTDKTVQTAPENAPPPSAGYPADPAMTGPAMNDPAMTPPAPTPGTNMDKNTPENPGGNPSTPGAPMQQP